MDLQTTMDQVSDTAVCANHAPGQPEILHRSTDEGSYRRRPRVGGMATSRWFTSETYRGSTSHTFWGCRSRSGSCMRRNRDDLTGNMDRHRRTACVFHPGKYSSEFYR